MGLIYQFLKTVVKIAQWIYYQRTTIVNREQLRFDGPAIVVSNHPCTLMDPLNVGSRAKEPFYFLANAGLFKSKFGNWFFNIFYCIPIERTEDTGGKPLDNAQNFARCDAHLLRGGTLYIAPEGTSWMKRHLHSLKTGTARIAFNSEQEHDYNLNLKIVPVGLTYSDPTAFRGKLLVNVGTPFYVRDFRELYAENPNKAVKLSTKMLEERLRTLIIDTLDEEEDHFVKQIEEIVNNSEPLQPEAEFNRTKKLIAALREWKTADETAYIAFQQATDSYFEHLKKANTSDDAVAYSPDALLLSKLLLLLIGLPIFLYGFLNHFFPAFVPFLIATLLVKRAGLYIGYTSTVKFALGVFTIPLFYWLQSELVESWFSTPVSWWYLLSLPVGGWLAWEYWVFLKKTGKRLKFSFLKEKQTLKESRGKMVNRISDFL